MTALSTRSDHRSSVWQRFASPEPLDVVPRLLALLVVPTDGGWITIAGVAAAAIVAATPPLLRNCWLWLTVGVVRLGIDFVEWHGIDDHEVLISYSCIAFGLALWSSDPERTARWSLPALVGLTMAFATAWKIGSGQFLDGDTLRYTLLTDPRFELATSWFGGVDQATHAANEAAVAILRDPSGVDRVTLAEPPALTAFAFFLTAGAVLLEGVLAIVFLHPRSDPVLRARLLTLFCLTTYIVVPVSRFGIVLCTCAYAGSEGRRDRGLLISSIAFCVVWPPIWLALGGTQ